MRTVPWMGLRFQGIELTLTRLIKEEEITMKKRFFTCVAIATLVVFMAAGPALAEGDNYLSNRVGVGYQGMISGDLINGISVRGWIGDNFGLEGSLLYGGVGVDVPQGELLSADVTLFEAKAMYAFIVKSNSRFYLGAKLGYGQVELEMFDGELKILDDDFWTAGAFVGAEWSFPTIPEVAFNFDVGYNYIKYEDNLFDEEGGEIELTLDGIAATFGIHYYF